MISYLALFSTSFLAATLVPFSSEVVLYGLIGHGEPAWLLVVVASLGNSLGAAVNWCLGRYLLKYRDRRWFYFKSVEVEKMQNWFQRYGIWSLLFSWVPLGGDVLTFIAGTMRVRFWLFFLLVAIGKTVRYTAVFWLSLWPLSA